MPDLRSPFAADTHSPFEQEPAALQIDPARSLLPEGTGGAAMLSREAIHAAVELWENAMHGAGHPPSGEDRQAFLTRLQEGLSVDEVAPRYASSRLDPTRTEPPATMTAYHPSQGEQLEAVLAGDSRAGSPRSRLAHGVVNVLDYATPLGMAWGAQQAFQEGDYQGAAMAMIPGPEGKVGRAARNLERDATKALKPKASALAPRPEFAERFPIGSAPVLTEKLIDPKTGMPGKPGKPIVDAQGNPLPRDQADKLVEEGKAFWQRGESQENKEIMKLRHKVQTDIDAGKYQTKPFFDVAAREDVDPAGYSGYASTAGQVPSKSKTVEKYKRLAEDPEAIGRLEEAYLAGKKMPDSDRWYFMRQLEQAFIKELGPDKGRLAFKERFAAPMAAMTGGNDPTGNLLLAAWGNWERGHGRSMPTTGYERAERIPSPVGGRYLKENVGQFQKMTEQGITPDNPKRWNFMWNFLGRLGPTIDEQMSKLWKIKGAMPEYYGPYQQALEKLASHYGVSPRELQEVAWAGVKSQAGTYKVSKPMIQVVNEAIERTSRITGVAPEEVVKRALIYGTMPLYGTVGVVAADQIASHLADRYGPASDQSM